MKRYGVKPRLTQAREIVIGGPSETDEYLYLGRLAESGPITNINFDLSHPHVVGIFGKRGSGKSYSLGSFVESLCTTKGHSSIGHHSRKNAVLLFDTLGIFQWSDIPLTADSAKAVIREQQLVQKGWGLDPENLQVEIWAPRGTKIVGRKYSEFVIPCSHLNSSDWGYLLGVDILDDRIGQLLNDAYQKVTALGWSSGSQSFSPQSNYGLDDLIACIENDQEIVEIYHRETRRALNQQLRAYSHNPLFHRDSPSKSVGSVEGDLLSRLLQPGKLSILLLHSISDEVRWVVLISLIRTIMSRRLETSELEKMESIVANENQPEIKKALEAGIPRTWIVADEAQNFLPSERTSRASDTLIRLVREGRNFGLSFMFTTQQPTAIDQRILAQLDTIISHKLTVQTDIDYIRKNLKSRPAEEVRFGNSILSFDDLIRSLDNGQAVVSNTDSERVFVLDIRPRVSVHGGFGE